MGTVEEHSQRPCCTAFNWLEWFLLFFLRCFCVLCFYNGFIVFLHVQSRQKRFQWLFRYREFIWLRDRINLTVWKQLLDMERLANMLEAGRLQEARNPPPPAPVVAPAAANAQP